MIYQMRLHLNQAMTVDKPVALMYGKQLASARAAETTAIAAQGLVIGWTSSYAPQQRLIRKGDTPTPADRWLTEN